MSSSTLRETGTHPKSEQTQQKLLEAGIRMFSENGYAATSTRQVQTAAGVQRNLITYHFGNKEAFWKACVTELFARINAVMGPAMQQARDIEPGERMRFVIRQFVRVSAAHPEMTRIMFDEGRCGDWRLYWIIDNHVSSFFDLVTRLHEESKPRHRLDISLTQFYYIIVGSAAVFAMAPECRQLTGEDPFDDSFVDTHADAIARLLVGP